MILVLIKSKICTDQQDFIRIKVFVNTPFKGSVCLASTDCTVALQVVVQLIWGRAPKRILKIDFALLL